VGLKVQTGLRDALYAAIVAARPNYVQKNIHVDRTYFPLLNLEEMDSVPYVKLVCTGYKSERERLLRDGSLEVIVTCQVIIQQRIGSDNRVDIDRLIEFSEEIAETLEDDFIPDGLKYSWMKTEPMRDAEGVPYSYQSLQVQGVFSIVLVPCYKVLIQRNIC